MFSPEVKKIPRIAGDFYVSGLLWGYLGDIFLSRRVPVRDLIADAEKYASYHDYNISGTHNLPRKNGALMVVNHPQIDILIPSLFKLVGVIYEETGRKDLHFLMGQSMPLENVAGRLLIPAVSGLVDRVAGLYPDNIVATPSIRTVANYRERRARTGEVVAETLVSGGLVVISPEAQVERDNCILPTEIFRYGTGKIAIKISERLVPQIPVGMWESGERTLNLSVGEPFMVASKEPKEAVIELMAKVAGQLPNNLRGPFGS